MDLLELLASLGITIDTEATTTDLLTPEDLNAAEAALLEAYATAREAADVETCRSLADAVEAVRGEVTARASAAAEAQALLDELDARIAGPEDEDEPAEDGATDEAPVEVVAEVEAPVVEDARVPVAAAARPTVVTGGETGGVRRHIDAQNRAAAARARTMPVAPAAFQAAPEAPRSVVLAGADLRGFSPGQPILNIGQLAEVSADRMEALRAARRGNPRMGGRFQVASIQSAYPEERILGSDPFVNGQRIAAAVALAAGNTTEAIVASGGLCAPVNVSYDLFGIGDDRRPIRDALVRFGANRGGIRFVAPPRLSNVTGAVEVWTEANDTTPSSPTTKPCATVTCGTDTEELVDAITKCLKVGNFTRQFWSEQFAEWWRLAGVQHAREAETRLWTRMIADSSQATTGEVLGAASDILENTGQAAAAYRSRHRMPMNAPIDFILPDWTPAMMQGDAVRRMPGDNGWDWDVAYVTSLFAKRNVVPIWTPDTGQEFGAQTDGAALLRWPGTVQGLLFAPGTHLFLDGGSLDFGMEIRDSTLNSTNDVQAFMETFEGTATVGVESIDLTMDVCPNGESANLVDANVCSTGS